MWQNISLATIDVANMTMTEVTITASMVTKDSGIHVGRMINIIARPVWIILGTIGEWSFFFIKFKADCLILSELTIKLPCGVRTDPTTFESVLANLRPPAGVKTAI